MKRFILISFGLMGWMFYVMSGGAEFQPASVKYADKIAAQKNTDVAQAEPAKAAPTTQSTQTIAAQQPEVSATELVTRVSLDLTKIDGLPTPTIAQTDAALSLALAVPDKIVLEEETKTALEANVVETILPSLIAPREETSTSLANETLLGAALDVRTVSGNRVNVRGGPGTKFDVVNRLVRGDEVEIIEDNGNGWVKMRPLTGGTVGWMADFLLASG